MIRPCNPSDFGAIVSMVAKGDHMTSSLIEERLKGKWTALVCEKKGAIAGIVAYMKEEDGEFNLLVYVEPSQRGSGIGDVLFSAGLNGIATFGESGRITTKYRTDMGNSQGFFRNRGFIYWYSMDSLMYDGPKQPDPTLPAGCEIIAYEDRFYDDFVRIMADSFFPQRRFFDFRPHDVRKLHAEPEDRDDLLKNRDNMLVLLQRGKVSAIAELENNFVGTIGVDPASQGRGFGRALMQQCINTVLDRRYRTVETSVVLGNLTAWRLYNVLGFRRTQTDEWACRWM